jgi:phosphoribosyl 1,2-cyclic phosphodiesterase
MTYHVLASGSDGNAVLYHDEILVDCGVPFASVRRLMYKIKIVLLTHEHGDHLNLTTLTRLALERPTLRIGAGPFLADKLKNFRNVDIYEYGQLYDYGQFSVSPVKLYHDCENYGYRIFKGSYKIFHATDTAHLNGITAKGYDLFAIEHNYDEEVIHNVIQRKQESGQFSYEKGAMNSHLSEQQARQFIFENAGEKYEVLRLHESKREYSKI